MKRLEAVANRVLKYDQVRDVPFVRQCGRSPRDLDALGFEAARKVVERS